MLVISIDPKLVNIIVYLVGNVSLIMLSVQFFTLVIHVDNNFF